MDNKELHLKAEQLRLKLINLIYSGGTGHTGGDLSVLNLLTVLYNHTLHVDAKAPKNPDRDRFVLSKGHCAEALYSVLNDKGFIPQSELDDYGKNYAHLGGHPNVTIPGVEINSCLGPWPLRGCGHGFGGQDGQEVVPYLRGDG